MQAQSKLVRVGKEKEYNNMTAPSILTVNIKTGEKTVDRLNEFNGWWILNAKTIKN